MTDVRDSASVTVASSVDSTRILSGITHGAAGYDKGCRCDECRAAKRAAGQAYRARKAAGRPASPVETVTADAGVLATAWAIAEGDPSRLQVQPDGSILVSNGPRRTAPTQLA